jgi:protein TonB
MYLFNNHEGCINKQTNRLPVAAISILGKQRTHFDILTGEENPCSIASLLLILVLLLHLCGALWLLQPSEPIMRAKPLMMEVSLVSAPGQQASTAPPAPLKAQEPKKTPVKKPLQKKAPEKSKQAKLQKMEAIAEEQLPAPSPVESTAQSSNSQNSSATTKATARPSPYTVAAVTNRWMSRLSRR